MLDEAEGMKFTSRSALNNTSNSSSTRSKGSTVTIRLPSGAGTIMDMLTGAVDDG
jgi:hypothetical protein